MDEQQKRFRSNYFVNVMDGAFYGSSVGLASLTTIIPLFISTMTNSAVMIGLIPAISNLGWLLPQLLTARYVSQTKRFKPFTMRMTVLERVPVLGLALVAWFLPVIGKPISLVLAFVCIAGQAVGAGLTSNPWQNLIAQIIPSDYRATFFGIQSSAISLFSSVSAILAGLILVKYNSPFDFTAIFTVSAFFMLISYLFLDITVEDEHPTEDPPTQLVFWKNVWAILKRDSRFRWYLVCRSLFQFGTMAFAFYTVYAVRQHSMNEMTAGIMASILMISQTVANPLLGWIADRWSKRKMLEAGAILGMLSALLAWLAPSVFVFYIVVALAGFCNAAVGTTSIAFSLDFGTDAERPTYVGLANTLIAPAGMIAPLFGGWLADTFGYSSTFIFAAVASLGTALLYHFFVTDPKPRRFTRIETQ